jgi:hypothetical protein
MHRVEYLRRFNIQQKMQNLVRNVEDPLRTADAKDAIPRVITASKLDHLHEVEVLEKLRDP